MKLQDILLQKSGNKCKLRKSETSLQVYEVLPQTGSYEDSSMIVCTTCLAQIEKKAELDSSH